MEKNILGYEDFSAAVDISSSAFIAELHKEFISNGCKIQVKESKSGYLVSYTLDKKTVANFVFRRTGLIIRIYANHIREYMEVLETLPDNMIKTIEAAPNCKRLINPDDCNPKCSMGYDFLLRGSRLLKCRSNAFMFLICEENNDFIKALLCNELKQLKKS